MKVSASKIAQMKGEELELAQDSDKYKEKRMEETKGEVEWPKIQVKGQEKRISVHLQTKKWTFR